MSTIQTRKNKDALGLGTAAGVVVGKGEVGKSQAKDLTVCVVPRADPSGVLYATCHLFNAILSNYREKRPGVTLWVFIYLIIFYIYMKYICLYRCIFI